MVTSGVINGDENINIEVLRRDSKPRPSEARPKYRDIMAVTPQLSLTWCNVIVMYKVNTILPEC
jgi:hypothetical protein